MTGFGLEGVALPVMTSLADHFDVPSSTDCLTAFMWPPWDFFSTLNTFLQSTHNTQLQLQHSRSLDRVLRTLSLSNWQELLWLHRVCLYVATVMYHHDYVCESCVMCMTTSMINKDDDDDRLTVLQLYNVIFNCRMLKMHLFAEEDYSA